MKFINLDERLKVVASFVTAGAKVADIGTDHAFLPVYLIQNKKASKVIACDINIGPLNNAKKTVESFNLIDKIELRLSDGLSAIQPFECDDIIIAGMGGHLISTIIKNTAWLNFKKHHLILQAMTKVEHLRDFLCSNGFYIKDEKAVFSKNHYYTVMSVYFSGESYKADDFFLYFGKLINKNDKDSINYMEKVKQKLKTKADGLIKQNPNSQKAKKILQLINKYDSLKR